MFIGLDGCKAGWVAAALDGKRLAVTVHPHIADAWACYGAAGVSMWIDMPVGLPDARTGERRCDREAQTRLGPRAASIFPAPCREALAAPDYAAANAAQRAALGKGLSRQAYNLLPKIREVDDWLAAEPAALGRVAESHPELCFAALAGRPLAARKTAVSGVLARLDLLAAHGPLPADKLRAALREAAQPLDGVGVDDVLDACVLAVCARLAADGTAPGRPCEVPAEPQSDARGLPMRIRFWECRTL